MTNNFKVLFIGDTKVGKSSLIQLYNHGFNKN